MIPENSWKVIHLSTGHEGGAGLAARRLNSALNAQGIQSTFGALKNPRYVPGPNEFTILRKFRQRLLSGLLIRIQRLLSEKVLFSVMSLNVCTLKQVRELGDPKNTILHFHNWYNLISQKEILRLNKEGYRIVLTLHDERFFTGGCHYAFECKKFRIDCNACPELANVFNRLPSKNLNSIAKLLEESNSHLVFIAPSRWIKEEALSSLLLKNQRVVFIPNTLGIKGESMKPQLYTPREPQSVLKIGIASMDNSSYIKGGDLILEVESRIASSNLQIKMIYLSQINEQDSPKEFWGMIDYLLVASRADNSPNVIHEAKSFGIPVIASDIGGISELIYKDYDIAIPGHDISSRKILEILTGLKSIERASNSDAMGKKFLDYVAESVESHKNLYLSLMKK